MTDEERARRADELLNIGAQAYRQGDYQTAKDYYEQSAQLGQSQAACNLGYIYAYGRLGQRDDERAFYYFSLAAVDGNSNALYKVGDAYYWGNFVAKSPQLAFKYYRKAERCLDLERDDDDLRADVYYRLALCYFHGTGTASDAFAALSYINLAHTYSYYDRLHDKFRWQSLAEKIARLREEIIAALDAQVAGEGQG